jgi:hypothetical protein
MAAPDLALVDLDVDALRDGFGFGVAGNFAGHLEQAGEAADFTSVATAAPELPKGIFPWYAPGSGTFLEAFPLSSDRLAVPPGDGEAVRLQLEPEVGVVCDVTYDDAGTPTVLAPRLVAAFDDCSIRRPGATRISQKKNWGAASKGVAARGFAVTDLDPAGTTATLRLACFLRRDDATHTYGVDSPVPGYTLYGAPLLDWILDRLASQREAEGSPLEDVGALLRGAGCPRRVLVGIGATRYEPYGESTFARAGDEAIVVLYDGARHDAAAVAAAIAERRDGDLTASVLRRIAAP